MAETRPEPVELPVIGQPPRERRDAAENRARILAVARRMLVERGGDEVSMDAVAAAAGVGKGTIFRHFTSRLGLMEAVIDEHMRDLQDAFISGPPPLGPGAPAAERLEAFVVELVRRQLSDIDLLVAGCLLLHMVNLLREIDPEINGEVVGGMILSAVSPPLVYRMRSHLQVDVEELEAAVRRLLRGVLPG